MFPKVRLLLYCFWVADRHGNPTQDVEQNFFWPSSRSEIFICTCQSFQGSKTCSYKKKKINSYISGRTTRRSNICRGHGSAVVKAPAGEAFPGSDRQAREEASWELFPPEPGAKRHNSKGEAFGRVAHAGCARTHTAH